MKNSATVSDEIAPAAGGGGAGTKRTHPDQAISPRARNKSRRTDEPDADESDADESDADESDVDESDDDEIVRGNKLICVLST